MIMKAMAITRCPYCHAIIDENDKYCNNCGTQLLFPEDDETDEEIPGEKILDAEVEEKDYTIDEPEDEKRPRPAADDDEDVDERLEEEMRDRAAETALDEIVAEGSLDEGANEVTEEVILVDELEEAGLTDTAGTGEIEAGTGKGLEGDEDKGPEEDEDEAEEEEAKEESEPEEDEPEEEPEEEEGQEEGEEEEEGKAEEEEGGEEGREGPEEPPGTGEGEKSPRDEETAEHVRPRQEPPAVEEEPEVEYIAVPSGDDEAGVEEVPVPRPVTFDTQELEGIGHTVELSKDKVDRLVAEMAEKEAAAASAPVAAVTPREATGSLPPWASGMKGAPVFPPDSTPIEGKPALRERGPTPEEEEEVEIFPKRRSPDSTLGLPERVGQSPLPFEGDETEGDQVEEEAGTGQEAEEETAGTMAPRPGPARPARPEAPPEREPGRRRTEAADDDEEPEARGPFSFTVFFKSKAFDALFVGLFWLVALWLAAHATDRTLFEVLGAVSGPMLLLYGVFMLLYFFLFKFFLGETLGDRLFRPRD
jgi:hypothetical protein